MTTEEQLIKHKLGLLELASLCVIRGSQVYRGGAEDAVR